MTYRELVQRLGEATADRVVAIWASYTEGLLTHDEAVDLIALTITAANERATVLADLGLAATLTAATRTVVLPHGLTRPAGDVERLQQAAGTLLAVAGLTEERVARLGRSEPLDAAVTARGDGIRASEHVVGWTRSVSVNACSFCRDLAGPVLPDTVPMIHHPGCSCTQTPITR